jgi:hypothetical protein
MAQNNNKGSGLVGEMMLNADPKKKKSSADLVVEPEAQASEADSFAKELTQTLRETEQAVRSLEMESDELVAKSWERARSVIEEFKPVPWFIWRLSNYVLGTSGQINKASEGLVFGLRRLLFAAASDSVLGVGEKVNSVHRALAVLEPDVLAASAVIHAVCRRLSTRQFERIWRPILDDALLRAQIGFFVGSQQADFGAGRGMLAGFAGRCGLAILIAGGELEQARNALEMLATGAEIKQVGLSIYGCDPLQVSAMTLSASGCGRDSAFGTVAYSAAGKLGNAVSLTAPQVSWQAAFMVTECIRVGKIEDVPEEHWSALQFDSEAARKELGDKAKIALRRGHGWNWLGAAAKE